VPTKARIRPADRRSRPVAEIIRAWRALTGGRKVRDPQRRTLVACSGGADSSALALALAAASDNLVIAHIVHDLRPEPDSLADRDAVRGLADSLGVAFVEGRAKARGANDNLESAARRARYIELARLARESACSYVAVAHHADDQLETMLMRLLRGSGPRGLAAMRASRPLAREPGILLLRPMLGITRADTEAICRSCGWEWRQDATNADTSRLRAAVRAGAAANLRALNPRAGLKAVEAAELLAGAAAVVASRARALLAKAETDGPRDSALAWPRAELREEPSVVLGELLRESLRALGVGDEIDRVPSRAIARAVDAIKGQPTRPRTFRLGEFGVQVASRRVVVAREAEPRDAGIG
jgi:tRNA(Ile)-lysidine synthase